jgi:hypothetical protein
MHHTFANMPTGYNIKDQFATHYPTLPKVYWNDCSSAPAYADQESLLNIIPVTFSIKTIK